VYLEVLELAKLKRKREKITLATTKQKEMWKIVGEIENKDVNDRSNVLQTLDFENNKVSQWEKLTKYINSL